MLRAEIMYCLLTSQMPVLLHNRTHETPISLFYIQALSLTLSLSQTRFAASCREMCLFGYLTRRRYCRGCEGPWATGWHTMSN